MNNEAKTYWNGEPCKAQRVTVIVADAPFPAYWARLFVGQRRPAVKVSPPDELPFYIDDLGGAGWAKVTEGVGSPRWGHGTLWVEREVSA